MLKVNLQYIRNFNSPFFAILRIPQFFLVKQVPISTSVSQGAALIQAVEFLRRTGREDVCLCLSYANASELGSREMKLEVATGADWTSGS
jgi:hypothetical protein